TGEMAATGPTRVRADSLLAASTDAGGALDFALARLRRPQRKSVVFHAANAESQPGSESKIPVRARHFPPAHYPPVAYRLLAGFRVWSTIHYFFPYKHLMNDDWDAALDRTIPRLEAARDSIEYGLALSEMCAHIHDSHVGVSGPVLDAYFGEARLP